MVLAVRFKIWIIWVTFQNQQLRQWMKATLLLGSPRVWSVCKSLYVFESYFLISQWCTIYHLSVFTLYNILVYKPAHCISTETLYRRIRPVFGKFWYYFLGGNKWYKIFKSDADHMLHYTKIQYIFNIRLRQLLIVSVHLHIHLPQYGRKLSGKTNLIKIDFSL